MGTLLAGEMVGVPSILLIYGSGLLPGSQYLQNSREIQEKASGNRPA